VVDAPAVLREFLWGQIELTTYTEERIWAERDTPPPDYTPADGGAICFKRRGGPIDYTGQVLRHSFQFKCYGADEMEANEVYRALFDVLNYPVDAAVRAAEQETMGQTLLETDTDWVFVLTFFEVTIFNE
jgi:hypothetical protein